MENLMQAIQETLPAPSTTQEMAEKFHKLNRVQNALKIEMGNLKDAIYANLGDGSHILGNGLKVVTKKAESESVSYKDAFENSLSKVNEATRNVLEKAKEESKKTSVRFTFKIS